jgi:hypothetical protein
MIQIARATIRLAKPVGNVSKKPIGAGRRRLDNENVGMRIAA